MSSNSGRCLSRQAARQRNSFFGFLSLIAISMLLPSGVMAADDEFASIDLTKAWRLYTIPNQNAFTVDVGDTVVVSTEIRYTHNGLGSPASLNEWTAGLMVTDSQNWWNGNQNDITIANRGPAVGTRLPTAPFVEGWINHNNFGVDINANLDPATMLPLPVADHVPQVSDWIRIDWTLTANAAGNVEGVPSFTSLSDPSISFVGGNPFELGFANGGAGHTAGKTLYGGYQTGWDTGFDDDGDPATPNVQVPKSVVTHFTNAEFDNYTVTKNGTVIISDDFSSYAAGMPIPGAVGADPANNWNPKFQVIDPDGVPDTGDEDNSQQFLFVASGSPVVGGLVCDFNADGQCDAADIDDLYGNFGGAVTYDVDGSGVVDAGDIGAWLAAASDPANLYLGGTQTFVIGDVDLDGNVDSVDLGLLLNNFGDTTGLLYGAGNMDDDANVDSVDLGLLLNNFGSTSASVAAVPEPGAFAMLLVAAMGLLGLRRRR